MYLGNQVIVSQLKEVARILLLPAAPVILLVIHLRLIVILEKKVLLHMEMLVHFQDLVFQLMILFMKNGQLPNGMNCKINI
jgi:hypothetical protein